MEYGPRRSPWEGVSPGLLTVGVRAWLLLGIAACVVEDFVRLRKP